MSPILFTTRQNSLQSRLVLAPIQKEVAKSVNAREFLPRRCRPTHISNPYVGGEQRKSPQPHPGGMTPQGAEGRLHSWLSVLCGVRDILQKNESTFGEMLK